VTTLPPGVTLQQIDGGPNYYANSGLTYAHNAGWDNPDFFPIGAWAAPIQTTADAARWAQLGWNTAWVPASANQSVIQAAGISLVISAQGSGGWPSYTALGFTPGAETVGIETYDEPNNSSQFYNGMSTVPNSVQDGRFWWVNNTINWLDYGSPATQGKQAAWLAAPQPTPDGSTRTINISSLDYYPFTRNDAYGPPSVRTTWGLSAPATSDQYRRGFFYGDIIDQERLDQPVSAPLMAIVENGGPFTTDTTAASYIQPAEMNWAVWESIIHGARGVMYFNNTFGGPAPSDDDMNTAYFQSAENEATFTATGSGSSLTVSSVTGQIFLGDVVSGAGVPAGTTILSQISGTEGGAGVYVASKATTASGASVTATQPTSIYAQTEATDDLVEQLAPVLNSPFAEGYATVTPASGEKLPLPLAAGTGASAFGGIDLSVHWYQGGDVTNRGLQLSNGAYIFASTRDSEYATNISATFTIADKNATSVTVVNEDRTIPVSNGVFTDTFATGATVHIYEVDDGSSSTPPAVTGVNASPATGTEHEGNSITFTVNMSEVVTVAGGTPTLTLNDGGEAKYESGSGTSALTFAYTVASSDTTVSNLAITAVNLPPGVTIEDSAGNAANMAGAIASFSGLSVDPPVTVANYLANEATLDALGAIAVADTGANVSANFDALNADTHVTSIAPIGVDQALTLTVAQVLNDTRALSILGPFTITIADTAAHLQTLSAKEIANLAADGLTMLEATDKDVSFATTQKQALGAAGVALEQPYGGGAEVFTYSSSGVLETAQYPGIVGRPYTSYIVDYGANGKPTSASYSNGMTATWTYNTDGSYDTAYAGVTGAPYTSYTVDYGANGKPTSASYSNGMTMTWTYNVDGSSDLTYAGLTGAYTSYTIDYGANGNATSASYSNGMTATWTYNVNGSYDLVYAGVTGQPYSSSETVFNTAHVKVATAEDMTNGSGAVLLYANGQTISSSAGARSITTGTDTFNLTTHSTEAITATGMSSETFEYASGFGQSKITGLVAGGAASDVIDLNLSMFSGLSSSNTAAQNFAALLSSGSAAQSGSNVTITDSAHDVLTLVGVTTTTLGLNANSVFRFA
jgi:hypothetical protein